MLVSQPTPKWNNTADMFTVAGIARYEQITKPAGNWHKSNSRRNAHYKRESFAGHFQVGCSGSRHSEDRPSCYGFSKDMMRHEMSCLGCSIPHDGHCLITLRLGDRNVPSGLVRAQTTYKCIFYCNVGILNWFVWMLHGNIYSGSYSVIGCSDNVWLSIDLSDSESW